VNLCSRSRPYSINCHGGAMLMSHMLYTEQNSLQKRTELSRCQWWVTNWQRERLPQDRTRNSKTSLAVSRCSEAWYYKVTTRSGTEMTTIGWFRHRWAQFSEVCWCGLMQTPGHTLCTQFSAERAANVVDLERQWWCGRTSAYAVWFELQSSSISI